MGPKDHQVTETNPVVLETRFLDCDFIKCFYTNADSLPNKLSELRNMIKVEASNIPKILKFTEVKPKNFRFSVGHADLNIPDYEMFSRNLDTEQGRGVAIYVHTSLQATRVDYHPQAAESLWLEIRLSKTDTTGRRSIPQSK